MSAFGRHWPRGVSRCIRDLRDGATVPEVMRRYGINYRHAIVLARRIRYRELRQDEAGTVSVIMALALPAMIVATVGAVQLSEKIVDHRIAQGCADSAALAAVVNGCPLGIRYGTANGCEATCSGADPATVTATHGAASATAVASSNPVRLIQ